MRFNWRRRLVVTAFAAVSMLPFAGCSSQQQQATDEVAAEGQQGDESQGEEEASAQGQGEDETAATQQAAGNPTAEDAGGGANVVTNNAAPAAEGSANGDLQEIITEMNGTQGGQVAANGEAPAAPLANAAAPDPAEVTDAAPVAAAPVSEVASDGAVTSGPGLPELGSKMPYVVEAGDTLAKIATKIYGDQKRWKDIAGLSGLDNPNHIYPGDLVYYSLDDASKTFASSNETVKRSKEMVQEGDTLVKIAQRVYGSPKLWKHIWRQNDHIENPDKLTAGMAVYYVDKSAVKSAFNKINKLKNVKFSKVTTPAKKMFKTAKIVTKSNIKFPTQFTSNVVAQLLTLV